MVLFFSATPNVQFCFFLVCFDTEPLHVAGVVNTARANGRNVVDLVAWAWSTPRLVDRARGICHEGSTHGGVALGLLAAAGNQGNDYCGSSLQPQCLHMRASLMISSRQSGHLMCVSGLGAAGALGSGFLPIMSRSRPHKRGEMSRARIK